ncbi:MAG: glycosyltransferase family 2 protein [Pseudomonadota bacterium]
MSDSLPPDRKAYPVSVVIPTLGGESLVGTIEQLNRGTVIPAEILVCIPKEEASRVDNLAFQNIRIIQTPCRGQVAQRSCGFGCAEQPLVLQLDDDTALKPEDLHKLIQALYRLGHGNAVAPIYHDSMTGHCLHAYHRRIVGWLQNLYAFLVCNVPWGAKRMGVISSAGVGYGVDENHCGSELVEVQWQPGGCVLCYREDLIKEDFYPFPGKAYCEDLIHSLLRRKRGVRLWILPGAYCTTSASPMPFSWSSIKAEMRARGYVVRLSGGKTWRLALWCITDMLKRVAFAVASWALPNGRLK